MVHEKTQKPLEINKKILTIMKKYVILKIYKREKCEKESDFYVK